MNFKQLLALTILFANTISIQRAHHFEKIDRTSVYMQIMAALFQQTIAPLYGDQTSALGKIFDAQDRLSYLLLDNEQNVLGVVIFKKDLSQEFENLGITNAIELKTLFVVNAEQNSGVGLGSQLLNQCLKFASTAKADNVIVTVSEEKPESLRFFERKGFKKIKLLEDKYKSGVTEFVLVTRIRY